MSNFFKNFPLVGYNFGNESEPALFQDISAYIKIIDGLRDDIAFYTTVHIQDYDRPDNFSYKLYGTTEFYWTFYYLNDDLRESGWPLPQQDLLPKAKLDYPHRSVLTTGDISKTFLPGHVVTGVGGASGTVIKRYLDLGQLIIDFSPANLANLELTFKVGELITPSNNGAESTAVQVVSSTNASPINENLTPRKGEQEQYDSVHHYENASKEYVDLGLVPSGVGTGDYPSLALKTPITYFDRIKSKNDSLREIKCLKPDVAVQVKSEFNKLLSQG